METEIKVFKVAETAVDKEAIRAWLKDNGCSEDTTDEYVDDIINAEYFTSSGLITDSEALVGFAGKRCYKSFEVGLNPNVTKIRRNWCEYLGNVLSSGHGSVFEHASFTFAIEGCTRVFTAEMNRHRVGTAISEQSLRYVRFSEEVPFWMPLSIKDINNFDGHDDEGLDEYAKFDPREYKLECKKAKTRHLFRTAFKQAQAYMVQLESIWANELAPTSAFHAKKQITSMMRRLIPMGVSTGAIYTINARQLRHIFSLRCTPAAEEEICYICGKMAYLMFEAHPLIFQDLRITDEGFVVPK
jgi:thymidylate synthase (FAD)